MFKKRCFFSLKYEVLVFSIALMVVPLLVLGVLAYVKSSEIIMQKVGISNSHTVNQVGKNIEMITNDIHKISLYIIQNHDLREYLKLDGTNSQGTYYELARKSSGFVYNLMASNSLIYSAYITGYNGAVINFGGVTSQIDQETIKKAEDLKGYYIWIYNTVSINYYEPARCLSLVRVLNDMNNLKNPLAILKIDLRADKLLDSYKTNVISKQGEFLLVDEKDFILYSTNNDNADSRLNPELADKNRYKEKSRYFLTKINGQNVMVTYYKIENTGLRLINLIPVNELLTENSVIHKAMFYTITISITVCGIIALLFSNHVLSPLKEMRKLMSKLENEDFDVYLEPKGNNEITLLSASFNKMSAKLKEVINQVYYAQLKQKEAELRALQTQVNPHFLYNTLDTIYWIGRMEKAHDTCKLIEALSRLFRLSLNSGNEITSVEFEYQHIRNYITIQEIRYEDMISFKLNVDKETFKYKTVKLVLQPLVENAIHHGIEKKGGKGTIEVTITKDSENLVYIVQDDGYGVDIEEINCLTKKVDEGNRGFAIKNVNDRIKLYFGEKYGLKFSNMDPGTKVTVIQPLVKGDKKS